MIEVCIGIGEGWELGGAGGMKGYELCGRGKGGGDGEGETERRISAN